MNAELSSLSSALDVTRRDFVVTTLAAGFALAVRPVSGETIHTDAEGLTAGEVQIPVADGLMPAYRATPANAQQPPVVLVVQEIFGVHEHIRDLCRRLAKEGYLAVAPELFARQGDVSSLTDIREILETIVIKVPDAQVLSDLDATVIWARHTAGGNTDKLAITGFCWGGRIAWLYAAHNTQLDAAVAWYGRLVGDQDERHPRHPVDIAPELHAPVLGLYGGDDPGIPPETIVQMAQALKQARKQAEFVVYPDVPHAFNADYRPSYRQSAAEDAWKRMLTWFRTYGVG